MTPTATQHSFERTINSAGERICHQGAFEPISTPHPVRWTSINRTTGPDVLALFKVYIFASGHSKASCEIMIKWQIDMYVFCNWAPPHKIRHKICYPRLYDMFYGWDFRYLMAIAEICLASWCINQQISVPNVQSIGDYFPRLQALHRSISLH